ncbi:LuxR C-terminal-related transcriptional regulator [Algihabitans albus]|uniref:LuxR C-terminal-related transcriptional regulator n=1 Tax=Algihabitans albus TaxID=2164067 RepID=UPI000E5CFCB3|nr:response regulator transcription factor [Algihabitans albus]
MPEPSVTALKSESDQKIDIALVDGTNLFREGVLRILSGTQFRVARHVDTIDDLLQLNSDECDYALAIVSLPDGDENFGEKLTELHRVYPKVRLVALAEAFDVEALRHCFMAGVDGFLLKTISSRALLNSLELVMLGERVFPRQLVNLILPRAVTGRTAAPLLSGDLRKLSDREMEIVRCLVAGNSNKVIAAQLSITEATVKVHLKSILRKIGASNRTQAAIWALHNGVQPLESAA